MLTMTRNRTPEAQATAAEYREMRKGRAELLREMRRRADAGDQSAADCLSALTAQPWPFQLPNPDRRADCARHAQHARQEYERLKATGAGVMSDILASLAQKFSELEQTASY